MNRGFAGSCLLFALALAVGIVLFAAFSAPVSATTEADNASLGAEISSFMQASSVETADDVEDGRFEAAVNRTDDPDARKALIDVRQARLEERNERLREQRATLGEAPDVRNRSVATRIAVGAAGLERSVNKTERVAASSGVDTERLTELRSSARELRGHEVAGLARGIAGPPGTDFSPPAGSSGDNRSRLPHADGNGPPGSNDPVPSTDVETGTDARDAERRGPPEHVSDGSDVAGNSSGTSGGPPDGTDEIRGPPTD